MNQPAEQKEPESTAEAREEALEAKAEEQSQAAPETEAEPESTEAAETEAEPVTAEVAETEALTEETAAEGSDAEKSGTEEADEEKTDEEEPEEEEASPEEEPAKKKKIDYRKRKKIAYSIFAVIMILITVVGVITIKMINDVEAAMKDVQQDVSTIDMRTESSGETEDSGEESKPGDESKITPQDLIKEVKPIAILLIGTDTGDFGRTAKNGLSDTLIYCVLRPSEKRMTMLSIPRDTYVEIVGRGTMDKINAAYSYGGAEMCINTVQKLLGLPVDAYAAINFAGFQEVIDAIGGITVNNKFDFSWDGYHFPEGEITLNGAEALAYVRMRKLDPEGDFGRSRRQRDVVAKAAKKCKSLVGAWNYQNILKALTSNVLTNVDLDTGVKMMSDYGSCLDNVESLDTLKGTGKNQRGWVYILDEQNLAEVTAMLREELELN